MRRQMFKQRPGIYYFLSFRQRHALPPQIHREIIVQVIVMKLQCVGNAIQPDIRPVGNGITIDDQRADVITL